MLCVPLSSFKSMLKTFVYPYLENENKSENTTITPTVMVNTSSKRL